MFRSSIRIFKNKQNSSDRFFPSNNHVLISAGFFVSCFSCACYHCYNVVNRIKNH